MYQFNTIHKMLSPCWRLVLEYLIKLRCVYLPLKRHFCRNYFLLQMWPTIFGEQETILDQAQMCVSAA